MNAMGIEDQNYMAIGMRDRVFLQLRFFRVQSASDSSTCKILKEPCKMNNLDMT